MSFLNPTPVPVTLYSSEDADAPQIDRANWRGAIKTIFKACLVTGYGGKTGQGWRIEEEDTDKATFTPGDPAAANVGLYVDSSRTSYSRFDLVWQGVRANIPEDKRMRLGQNPSRDNPTQPWYLLATPRSVCFLPIYTSGAFAASVMLYFGQIRHNLTHPAGQDFAYYLPCLYGGWNLSTLEADTLITAPSLYSAGSLGAAGTVAAMNANVRSAASSYLNGGSAPLANPVTASRLYAPLYITCGGEFIGQIPGLLIPSHRLESDATGQVMRIDDSPHDWLFTHQASNVVSRLRDSRGCGLLVNCNEWVY